VSNRVRRRTNPVRHKALFLARRPTSSRRVLPDFLIIGTQRGGTTSLHHALAQHPAITMSFKREVHYFDWNYDRGIEWYRTHFPTRHTQARSLRRNGEFATGEKSPYYLFDPAVPARVRALLPDVKLVVLLRDPVARAFSHYHKASQRGDEPLSLEHALASELRQGKRPRDLSDPRSISSESTSRSYIGRGRYAEQLERWLGEFDHDQIHVTLSERYFADPAEVSREIHRFIGLTPVTPRSFLRQGGVVRTPMPAALRSQLQEIFADDVRRLTGLLGESPGWW
jgi:hypothetical protein